MKVALYYPWIHLTSGAERVILEIATRSRHQYTIYTNHFDREATYPGFRELDVRELRRVSVDRSILNVVRAGWTIYRDEMPLTGYDALFVVCEGLGDLVALRHSEIPSICYCLTPLRVAFDTAYQARALAKRGLLGRLLIHAGVRAFRAIDRRAWKNYRSVVFISTEARKRASEGGLLQGLREELIWPGLGIFNKKHPGTVASLA